MVHVQVPNTMEHHVVKDNIVVGIPQNVIALKRQTEHTQQVVKIVC